MIFQILTPPEQLFNSVASPATVKPSRALFDLVDVLFRLTHSDWIILGLAASFIFIGGFTIFCIVAVKTPLRKTILDLLNHYEALLEKDKNEKKV